MARQSTPAILASVDGELGAGGQAAHPGRGRTDQREHVEVGFGHVHIAADHVHREVAQQAGSGRLRGVDQEVTLAASKDPHVSLDVALAVEQRGVTAATGFDFLDVAGYLTLKELGRVGPGHRDCRPLPPHQAALFPQLAVFGVKVWAEL